MNSKAKIKMVCAYLIADEKTREATILHLCGGYSARKAEKKIHGKQTNTVSRTANRVREFMVFVDKVSML